MIYLQLFLSFLQIGLFSFGGGYAAMPLIQEQVTEIHPWLSMSEFTDLITISQMTPGPIAVNGATFIGIKMAGIPGALVATFGCILPSCVIVMVIAKLYLKYRNMSTLQGVLNTLRPGRGCHDRLRRRVHPHFRLLGQRCRHLPLRDPVEHDRHLHRRSGSPAEDQLKPHSGHGPGGRGQDRSSSGLRPVSAGRFAKAEQLENRAYCPKYRRIQNAAESASLIAGSAASFYLIGNFVPY